MHHFHYKAGALHCEDVALSTIAEAVGTPVYVYSSATLRRHYDVIDRAFAGLDRLIAYSVKANSNLAVIRTLAQRGAGADVVSAGEMQRALRAGVPADRIVFSGVGKTQAEMEQALHAGIYEFNVEGEAELEALSAVATSLGVTAPIALRVNPDVAAGGHANISTGKSGDKFGVPWAQVDALYARAASLPGLSVKGVAVHIGSQIGELAPMEEAFAKVVDLVHRLRAQGHDISRLDLGGGVAIPYREGEAPAHPDDYARMVARLTRGLGVRVILEPGRVICGNAGVLLTRALYRKAAPDRNFLIVDAAMNDLMRPALYDAWHDILPVREADPAMPAEVLDVVGPVCESTDRFAKLRSLPPMSAGDLMVLLSAGAYGATLSSQYNTRPLVPEVLVDGGEWAVVRRRPEFEEMIALEAIPAWLT